MTSRKDLSPAEAPPGAWTLNHAHAQLAQGNVAAAARVYQQLIERGEKSYPCYHNLGVALYKLGHFRRARHMLQTTLQVKPASARAHYVLGLVLKESGKLKEALEAFAQALALAPGYLHVLYARADAHFQMQQFSAAAEDLEQVVRLNAQWLAARYNLGITYLALSRWQEAQEQFSYCAGLDPAGKDEYHNLLVETGRSEAYEEAYALAHRIKNMVSLLSNKLETLSAELSPSLSARHARDIRRLLDEHNQLFGDMANFLSAIRREPLELDLADVHQVIDAALFTASEAVSHVEVIKNYDPHLPEIICDTELLREAFLNIIFNAGEAMEDAGLLAITTSSQGEEAVFVVFMDTGPGFAAADREQIFRLGYSTKRFGSGIGLSQARRAVEIHGGQIRADSLPGEGARLSVILPASPRIKSATAELVFRPELFEDMSELLAEEALRRNLCPSSSWWLTTSAKCANTWRNCFVKKDTRCEAFSRVRKRSPIFRKPTTN